MIGSFVTLFLQEVSSFRSPPRPSLTRSTIRRQLPFFLVPEKSESSFESIQQDLVRRGLAWKQTPVEGVGRVPGCVATVYLQSSITQDERINIVGNADAVISRGLLALLADFLQDHTLDEVLALDPSRISQQLNIQSALSPGRNDGLANMLSVVQSQLRGDYKAEEAVLEEKSLNKDRPTVALLLSGGVDSSVALRLLQQDGYEVTAFYLKIWLEDELAHLGECPWEADVAICQEVCKQATVPLRIMSLQEEYHERVMQHTLQEAATGRTPNPDILCNSRVKFGCFLDSIDPKDFDYVASGHYAQVVKVNADDVNSPVKLVRAPDPIKDQSYFLCALSQSQLQRLLFPIGHLQKTQVRDLADHFELPNRSRPDSQGLCFLGKVKFSDFLNIHLGSKEGDIIDAFSGEIIGRHQGVWYHTVGQRKGIGKSLYPLATSRGPWYVVAKDPKKNIVFASNQYDEEIFAQSRSEFHVEDIHWISGKEQSSKDEEFRLSLKIRHGPRLVKGSLQTQNGNEGIVTLDEKDGGLAPGQYAVFYNDNAECLGGGIISERHWAKFLFEQKSRNSTVMST